MPFKKEYQRIERNDRELRFLSVSLLLANFDSQRYDKGNLLIDSILIQNILIHLGWLPIAFFKING